VTRTDGAAKAEQEYATQKIVSTQGKTTLADEISRLRDQGIFIHVADRFAGVGGNRRDLMREPFVQVVAERSIMDHVQELARIHGLVAVIVDGYIAMTTEENAATYRAKRDEPRRDHERLLATLASSVGISGPSELPDFLDAVGRSHGLTVLPSEAAWNSPVTLSLSAGTTLREALDQLRAHGLRWALRNGTLYVLK
jgi:hypothetical protein